MTDTPSSPATPADHKAEGGIAKAALVTQSGVGAGDIDAFVAAGLVSGPDAAGLYDPDNVTRLRLLVALKESGLPLDRLAAAVKAGQLSLDFAGAVIAEQPTLTATTVGEACAVHGTALDDFRRLMLALGLAAPAATDPIREDDAELLVILSEAMRTGLTMDAILGVFRSFAMNMNQIVATQRELFRREVEDKLIAAGLSYGDMFARAAVTRLRLQRLGYRTTFLMQRRFLEASVYDNIVTRFEEALEANAVERPRSAPKHTLCFLDLSGFTERTETMGDAHAAELASTLVEIAQVGAAEHRGQLIKALGDGAMLHFARADDAVRCALAIVERVRGRKLPPARAGISTGPVIIQDGDYYGRTVNRAARLIGVAAPEQVLVTAETVKAVPARAFHFADLGAVALKGVNEDIHAFAASLA